MYSAGLVRVGLWPDRADRLEVGEMGVGHVHDVDVVQHLDARGLGLTEQVRRQDVGLHDDLVVDVLPMVDRLEWQQTMAAVLRDQGSRGFTHPAGYMYKHTPEVPREEIAMTLRSRLPA